MSKIHGVGIIGCGYIGAKRAEVLKKFPSSKLVIVADLSAERAKALADQHSCAHATDWKVVTRHPDVTIVLVSTTNDMLAEITIDAVKHNKHVLVEKPAARNPAEMAKILEVYEKSNVIIKVGLNHRHHPAIEKAQEIIRTENIGDVMFIRARYGHGARVGYEKEWRSFRATAGGGEMLDQGIHIVDLARLFMGDFASTIGYCTTCFWDMEVEDNGFALMSTKDGRVAQLHASCTQWKNIFSMEIFCKTGQINIDGLGKSYGKETLTFYKMKPEMGPPPKFVYEWDEDNSWEKEYACFVDAIATGKEPSGSIYDAAKAVEHIFDLYAWSEKHYGPLRRSMDGK